jgi:phosphoglycerate dehydrogenase-like enzyme
MKILVITPIKHIKRVSRSLESIGDVDCKPDPKINDLLPILDYYDIVYTNPNKSKIFIDETFIDAAKKLKIICTASTGLNHIDIEYARKKSIKIISLTKEFDVIKKITSTAEHAFALTMASIRNLIPSYNHVLTGSWNYEYFIGRQVNGLNIGVIGYGRLGLIYSKYCLAFGAKVRAYDPYKKIDENQIEQVNSLKKILEKSDVVSLHVHVNDETKNLINQDTIQFLKKDAVIINTSRGEIVNESEIVDFLIKNPKAKIATDVLFDEIRNREKSPLLQYSKKSDQVLITPHIGGMTLEAQDIAYNHVVKMLKDYLKGS